MLRFPNCKINIGLNILAKRPDGYHDIETLFYPVAIKDALEIVIANNSSTDVTFTASGLPISGETDSNLCIKAYQLLKKDFPALPAVKIHLHKIIPMGAGLGGGSADAACTLQLLNETFKLNLSLTQLLQYALLLGSDCPFFINNKPAVGTGRGEVLEPCFTDLSNYKIILVYPAIHVNTKETFEALKLDNFHKNRPSIKQLISQPVKDWKSLLKNDFEIPVFAKYPEIKNIKDLFYQYGAVYAAMSGSGSTVYGLFNKNEIPAIKWNPLYYAAEHSL